MVFPNDNDAPFADGLLAMMQAGMMNPRIGGIMEASPDVVEIVKGYNPISLASIFSGMLTAPELQCNTIRLEILIHLVLATPSKKRFPNQTAVANIFRIAGEQIAGHLEDPAEDVFVSNILTSSGDFLLLEGVWEGGTYFTQRMINALEIMPRTGLVEQTLKTTKSILRISDLICKRANLIRNQKGSEAPLKILPRDILAKTQELSDRVFLDEEELGRYGLKMEDLAEFIFDLDREPTLIDEEVGNSSLERRPFICVDGHLIVILPSAISVAIRRYIYENFRRNGLEEDLVLRLARIIHHG